MLSESSILEPSKTSYQASVMLPTFRTRLPSGNSNQIVVGTKHSVEVPVRDGRARQLKKPNIEPETASLEYHVFMAEI